MNVYGTHTMIKIRKKYFNDELSYKGSNNQIIWLNYYFYLLIIVSRKYRMISVDALIYLFSKGCA